MRRSQPWEDIGQSKELMQSCKMGASREDLVKGKWSHRLPKAEQGGANETKGRGLAQTLGLLSPLNISRPLSLSRLRELKAELKGEELGHAHWGLSYTHSPDLATLGVLSPFQPSLSKVRNLRRHHATVSRFRKFTLTQF